MGLLPCVGQVTLLWGVVAISVAASWLRPIKRYGRPGVASVTGRFLKFNGFSEGHVRRQTVLIRPHTGASFSTSVELAIELIAQQGNRTFAVITSRNTSFLRMDMSAIIPTAHFVELFLADALSDFISALTGIVKQNPAAGVWALLIFTVLAGGGLGLSFLKPHEILKGWWEQRKDAKLDAASETVAKLGETLTWLRVALDVGRDSVERANSLRAVSTASARETAMLHLADWTQRLFGFLEADINKVTLWVPMGTDLIVAVYNGMRPESAAVLRLPLQPVAPKKQTFAVLAYHSKQMEICSDIDNDRRYQALAQVASHPYKSIIAVPLIVGTAPVGVLTIDSLRVGAFDDEDAKQLAQLCASLMAVYFNPPSPPATVTTVPGPVAT